MTVAGISCKPIAASTGGTIVGDNVGVTHNFGTSSIFAHGVLQEFQIESCNSSTEPRTSLFISQYVDGAGTHNVSWNAVFSSTCTSVTWLMAAADGGGASGVTIVEYFA
jgi:hypothetical protein